MTRRSLLRAGAGVWLAGWALFGLPWNGLSLKTHRPINVVPFRRHTYRRRDLGLNFAYYVPAGVIGSLLGWPLRAVLVVAAVLSGSTELIQVFSHDRYPSITDLILNVAGAAAGALLILAWRDRRRGPAA